MLQEPKVIHAIGVINDFGAKDKLTEYFHEKILWFTEKAFIIGARDYTEN